MKEVVQFLLENPDLVEKVKNGTVTLIGVSKSEAEAIISVLHNKESLSGSSHYWR
ncbi:competence pheromone ComX [Alteribacter lacisalsi]|uniref:ComX pheromone n=1 Tax=Alteribacter lacisalsi TaxID=2045244 RepID=A0A2W0HFM6_9BACI|nr:competence pheromone ComX [Alteribacter lacisalsi]PYZ98740.1 competence pheromone ComX [Alteribacter lacisalsi]